MVEFLCMARNAIQVIHVCRSEEHHLHSFTVITSRAVGRVDVDGIYEFAARLGVASVLIYFTFASTGAV